VNPHIEMAEKFILNNKAFSYKQLQSNERAAYDKYSEASDRCGCCCGSFFDYDNDYYAAKAAYESATRAVVAFKAIDAASKLNCLKGHAEYCLNRVKKEIDIYNEIKLRS